MNNRMILFDLDGTLWDSAREVADSWNEKFDEARALWADSDPDYQKFASQLPVKLTAADIQAVMGKTMKEIAENLMPDSDPEKRASLFKKCETYEVEYIEKTGAILYPEVCETMQELLDKSYRLAVVSNCQINYVRAFIRSMKMDKYFCDYEEWGRTGKPKSENIKLVMDRNNCSEAIYVGDTIKDYEAAKAAGIPFVLASYGFGEVSEPDAEISNMGELPDAADKLFAEAFAE